jgi:hypothetical protein
LKNWNVIWKRGVNVVYETKPGKWLVRCRLYD